MIELRGDVLSMLRERTERAQLLSRREQFLLKELSQCLFRLMQTQQTVRAAKVSPSSIATLGFMVRHERVHAIGSWADLQRRVGGSSTGQCNGRSDRLCFGLFHAGWRQTPLVFLVSVVQRVTCCVMCVYEVRLCARVWRAVDVWVYGYV